MIIDIICIIVYYIIVWYRYWQNLRPDALQGRISGFQSTTLSTCLWQASIPFTVWDWHSVVLLSCRSYPETLKKKPKSDVSLTDYLRDLSRIFTLCFWESLPFRGTALLCGEVSARSRPVQIFGGISLATAEVQRRKSETQCPKMCGNPWTILSTQTQTGFWMIFVHICRESSMDDFFSNCNFQEEHRPSLYVWWGAWWICEELSSCQMSDRCRTISEFHVRISPIFRGWTWIRLAISLQNACPISIGGWSNPMCETLWNQCRNFNEVGGKWSRLEAHFYVFFFYLWGYPNSIQ